ncbi:Holliday junction resolvase RuvX [Thermaerobacter subterraneus]|uniref:Multifunctional fusion protein n=1 Tax=Thermaerobacter subterraneus DSM 13965 TaxID=867903 RepID=K6PLN1_9FIRM|nr:Holliday junction resolvase RuvX [Thermaerobacter subterraneus]EKP93782.1 RNAse H-fold protein YqgF [Thermaerobacter subterraneus DSM 13965]
MRWLGLDLGSRVIGVAISDPEGILARPLASLPRQGDDRDIARVVELARQHGAEGIVVGWPRRLDGRRGPEAEAAEAFAAGLQAAGVSRVTLWDERLSTVQAERVLIDADLSRRRRKAIIDRMAATVILQAFLEAQRRQRATGGESPRGARKQRPGGGECLSQQPVEEGGGAVMDLPEERRIVTFRDENGEEQQFVVIDLVEMNDRKYAIVADPDDEEEAFIFRLLHEDDGTPVLVEIEDDEEWDAVAEAWEDMVAEEEDEAYADEVLGPDEDEWEEEDWDEEDLDDDVLDDEDLDDLEELDGLDEEDDEEPAEDEDGDDEDGGGPSGRRP